MTLKYRLQRILYVWKKSCIYLSTKNGINKLKQLILVLATIFFCYIFQSNSNEAICDQKTTPIFNFTENDIAEIYAQLQMGGQRKSYFSTDQQQTQQHVAIIVPYRNRTYHLSLFLRNMHYFLHKQKTNYGIFIVEQIENQMFNRGKLMNAGFLEALKDDGEWNCFFFHDVDLLPENLNNTYKCDGKPTHFTSAIDRFGYDVPYFENFGGVCALFKKDFIKINGFSNDYWGWGGEDDDLRRRIVASKFNLSRTPPNLGRYRAIQHNRDKGNPDYPCRYKVLNQTFTRFHQDGLSNMKYKLLTKVKKHLYTHIFVDLEEIKSKQALRNAHTDFKDC